MISGELSKMNLMIFILLAGLSVEATTALGPQDLDRSMPMSAHQKHDIPTLNQFQTNSLPVNQRPTQFLVQAPPTLHSRGALIMPANQAQTNNQPTTLTTLNKRQQQPKQTSNLLTTSTAGQNSSDSLRAVDQLAQQKSYIDPNTSDVNPTSVKNFFQGNIELALRQTSTDENVFQPSPVFSLSSDSSNNFDWLTSSQNTPKSVAQNIDRISQPQPITSEKSSEQTNPTLVIQHEEQHQSLSSTTEQSNIIALNEYHSQQDNQFTSPQVVTLSSGSNLSFGALNNVNSGSNGSAEELNNQVFYEGPATAPPANEYYFSSAEKLPNKGRASNAWWALGFGAGFEQAINLSRDDYLDFCSRSELLVNNKQRALCKTHPKFMHIVARGLKLAIDECQLRFSSSRWNCSLYLQNTLDGESSSKIPVFGDVMKHPNRERSFLNAIFAAGLAHTMTKACSQGELPEECSCDKKIKSRTSKNKIEWVACSDDIDYGARFSRDFTDSTDFEDSETVSMINTHNYEVGRRVFKSTTDITCTCLNGENSLCQTKRCWKHLGPFTDIGDELMKRYESATHVQPSNKDPHKLRPVRRGVRKPKRKDLVYIDESPDYCNADTRLGILGTQNRRCNSTSLGSDSCSIMCCGRGYQVVVEELEEDCNCKFVWCCQVKCSRCKRNITSDVCN